MPKETRISALISETTRDLLEKHVRATGVKKGQSVWSREGVGDPEPRLHFHLGSCDRVE
jgi:hypothetical protein